MIYLLILLNLIFLGLCYYLFFSPSSQFFGTVYYRFKTDKKEVALTFDDGPNEPYTSSLLAVLKKHEVKATFFCCGACITRYPGVVKKIHTAGHVIGNHSHDHNLLHYLNIKNYIVEVSQTSKLIKNEIGISPKLYRSPWLFRSTELLRSLHVLHLVPMWGTFGSELEVFQPKPRVMAKRALRLAKPGRIYIFHDGRESRGGDRANTIHAIDLLIPELKAKGYSFVQVSEKSVSK